MSDWFGRRTTLFEAAARGDDEAVRRLATRPGALAQLDPEGRTALHCALVAGQAATAELLLALGADPAARDRAGRDALRLALDLDAPDLVPRLLARGARPEPAAVIEALVRGRDQAAASLLSAGVDPTAALETGLARSGTSAVLRRLDFLLDRGADPLAADAGGLTPLLRQAPQLAPAVVDLLAGRGLDLTGADRQGRDLLFHAARGGNRALVERLLALGFDPDRTDLRGVHPHIAAAGQGHRDLANRLRELGAARRQSDPDPAEEARLREERERAWREARKRQSRSARPAADKDGPDHYALLDVSSSAAPADIRKAYLKRMKEFHPDRFMDQPDWVREEAERRAKRVNEAYETLKDKARRAAYDLDRGA